MDLAYDHIQESNLPKDDEKRKGDSKDPKTDQPQSSLNDDLQDAYKALSTSAWGMRIGGFLGNAVKQVRGRPGAEARMLRLNTSSC